MQFTLLKRMRAVPAPAPFRHDMLYGIQSTTDKEGSCPLIQSSRLLPRKTHIFSRADNGLGAVSFYEGKKAVRYGTSGSLEI